MRIAVVTMSGRVAPEEVIAEPFEIEGSGESFAVHRSIGFDWGDGPRWSATHVQTGLSVARGETIDATIEAARLAWSSRTPEEIAEVKARRAAEIAALQAEDGSLQ